MSCLTSFIQPLTRFIDRYIACVLLSIVVVSSASSANAKVIIEYLPSPKKEAVIKVTGRILYEDADHLKSAFETVKRKGYKLKLNAISFNTRGGSGTAAREMGRYIRKQGLFTYVGVRSFCGSACIYAFSGGLVRMAYGRFTVHRTTYLEELSARQITSALAQADLDTMNFIIEMGLSDQLIDAILNTPNWASRELEMLEKRRWGIHGMDRFFEETWFRASAKKYMMPLDSFVKHFVINLKPCEDAAVKFQSNWVECTEELL